MRRHVLAVASPSSCAMRTLLLVLCLLAFVPVADAVPPPGGDCVSSQGTQVSITPRNCVSYVLPPLEDLP